MRRIIFIIIPICLFFDCNTTTEVSKLFIYSVVNEIIRQDSIHARIVCSKFYQVEMPDSIIQKFFSKDAKFVKSQLDVSDKMKVDTGMVFFYNKKKWAFQRSYVDTSCSQGILYRLAYPVFSKDLQTVAIGITEDCNCNLGGWGFAAVYHLKNNKWTIVSKYYGWIS